MAQLSTKSEDSQQHQQQVSVQRFLDHLLCVLACASAGSMIQADVSCLFPYQCRRHPIIMGTKDAQQNRQQNQSVRYSQRHQSSKQHKHSLEYRACAKRQRQHSEKG